LTGETDVTVFESGAMMIYLAEKAGQFLPTAGQARAATLSWLMYQMGGIGPMFGQFSHFSHSAPEKLPYAIKRYRDESLRLLTIMDKHLAQSEYLAGDDYTIADMITYPWVYRPDSLEPDEGALTHVRRWIEIIKARPAVEKAMSIEIKKPDA
jgi:GST-like protein